jgi:hypothetical protein
LNGGIDGIDEALGWFDLRLIDRIDSIRRRVVLQVEIKLTEKTSLLALQARPVPDVAPTPAGDEFLHRSRELRRALLQRAVDVSVADDLAASFEAGLEDLAVGLAGFEGGWRHCCEMRQGLDGLRVWGSGTVGVG